MLRAVVRKAVSDVRGRPLQTALLLIVIAAAAATLSVALNVQASAARPYERLREESNGADAWIVTRDSRADLSRLSGLASVVEVGEPYPVAWLNYGIRKGEKKQEVALVGMGPDLPEFDHPVVTKGRWLAAGGGNEVVVDAGAADILGLTVGKPIDLLTPGGNRTMQIVGFAVTASRNPAPLNEPAFLYMLPETLQEIEPDAVWGSSGAHTLRAGVRLANPDDPILFREEARATLGGQFELRYWQDVRAVSEEANEFDLIFLQVFAVFALFASGLIVANAVGGQVLSQLHDIGILKAVGFTPWQVTASLLVQNLGLSLVASAAGVIAGWLVAPFFLRRSADILGVPATAAFDPVLLLITGAVIALIVALFTLLPAWRAGRVSAIEALMEEATGKSGRVSRLAQAASRVGLPRVVVVGIKDLSRRPARTAMTVAALVMAVITATFSLGIESTFDKTMSDPTVIGGPPFDIGADRDSFPDAQARQILDAHPDIERYTAEYTPAARYVGRGFDLRGLEGDINAQGWALREGRMPARAGEAAMSTLFASEFGVEVGESITVSVSEEGVTTPLEVEIVGRYADVNGRALTVTRDTLTTNEPPTDYLIEVKPGTDARAIADSLVEASGGVLDPEIYSETIDEIRDQWRPVLIGLNAVLLSIAGINLLSSQLLSIRERRRDFAVLKTVGFTPAQIVGSVMAGGAVLALVAVAIGIPLGLVASRVMFDALSSAAEIGTGVGELPGALRLAPLVPLVLLVTVLASAVPARIASSLQVAEAMRHE
jgi:putative ABC transport system permease protein